MNFNSLEYVPVIAAEGSFTKAARRLHVTQQTLSAHVAALERELGVPLFVRTTPLELTHEGEVFIAHAKRLADGVLDLKREIASPGPLQTGALRIGIAHTRGRVILPPVIEQFCKRYPNVSVELSEASNAGIDRALAEGELDIAIAAFERTPPGIELRDYYRERVVLLVTEKLLRERGIDPDAIAEPLSHGDLTPLATCPFVLGPPEDITGELALRLLEQSSFTPIVRARSSNMETLLALSLRGIGASLDPQNLVDATATPAQKRGLRAYELGESASYMIRFGLPARGYRWSVTEAFIETAQELLPR